MDVDALTSSLPRMGEDSFSKRATFRPDTENVSSCVNVTVVSFAAVRTNPMSYFKPAHTFRTAVRKCPTARAGLSRPSFRNGSHHAICRHRLIQQHVTERRPPSVKHGLSHVCLYQGGRAHVSDVDFIMVPNNLGRDYVQKVFALIGDLRSESAGANGLSSPLQYSKFSLRASVVRWHFDLFTVTKDGKVFQTEINPNGRSNMSGIRLGQFDLNVDVPSTTCVGGEVPGPRFPVIWQRPRQPKVICAAAYSQFGPVKFGRSLKVREWNPIKVALKGSEARRLRENCITRGSKLSANCIDSIRVKAEFFSGSPTQIGQIKGGRPFSFSASVPASLCLAIRLATEIPDVIDRTSLCSERALCGGVPVFDAVLAAGEDGACHVIDSKSKTGGWQR